jgi:hypothetical protein
VTETIDVFVSYKREERPLAEVVTRALVAAGFTTVSDLNLETGSHFGAAIDQMIRRARLVVVLWTRASVGSKWVTDEARFANETKKYLGVMLEQADLPVDLRYVQYEDLAGTAIEPAASRIVAAVSTRLGGAAGSADAAQRATKLVNDEFTLFQNVEKIGTAEAYRTYLTIYPQGLFVEHCRARIRKLTGMGARLR